MIDDLLKLILDDAREQMVHSLEHLAAEMDTIRAGRRRTGVGCRARGVPPHAACRRTRRAAARGVPPPAGQANADSPVIARPTMRAWTASAPS